MRSLLNMVDKLVTESSRPAPPSPLSLCPGKKTTTTASTLPLVAPDILHTIDVDLERTMPDHPFFRSGGEGIASLKRILLAVAIKDVRATKDDYERRFSKLYPLTRRPTRHLSQPGIGYLQGMNFLCAFILLTFRLDDDTDSDLERDTFDVLKSIVTKLLRGYYAPGLTQLLGDTEVLRQLVAKTDPKLHSHLCEVSACESRTITSSAIFSNCKPTMQPRMRLVFIVADWFRPDSRVPSVVCLQLRHFVPYGRHSEDLGPRLVRWQGWYWRVRWHPRLDRHGNPQCHQGQSEPQRGGRLYCIILGHHF